MTMNTRGPNSVFAIVVALLAGIGFGYLVPRCVAGWSEAKWMPLSFDMGMELSTETSTTVIPHAPNFVRQGGCNLSGQAKLFPPADNRAGTAQLGYVVTVAPGHGAATGREVRAPSTYRVQFGFTLMDADGFQIRYIRSGYHLLNPDESYTFRGYVDQLIGQDQADRVKKVDCRLCFEGIEVP